MQDACCNIDACMPALRLDLGPESPVLDGAAAETKVVLIKNRRLSGGDVSQRVVEMDLGAVPRQRGDLSPGGLGGVADFDLGAERSGGRFFCNPMDGGYAHLIRAQLLQRPNDQRILSGVFRDHIIWFGRAEPQSFALPDGVESQPLVSAEQPPVPGQRWTWAGDLRGVAEQERAVVAGRPGSTGPGCRHALPPADRTRGRSGAPGSWCSSPSGNSVWESWLLAEGVQHVGLVFVGIDGRAEAEPAHRRVRRRA